MESVFKRLKELPPPYPYTLPQWNALLRDARSVEAKAKTYGESSDNWYHKYKLISMESDGHAEYADKMYQQNQHLKMKMLELLEPEHICYNGNHQADHFGFCKEDGGLKG